MISLLGTQGAPIVPIKPSTSEVVGLPVSCTVWAAPSSKNALLEDGTSDACCRRGFFNALAGALCEAPSVVDRVTPCAIPGALVVVGDG